MQFKPIIFDLFDTLVSYEDYGFFKGLIETLGVEREYDMWHALQASEISRELDERKIIERIYEYFGIKDKEVIESSVEKWMKILPTFKIDSTWQLFF